MAYTITVVNQGPFDSPATSIEETLPAEVRIVSAVPSQGQCVETGCGLGALPPGGQATITVTVVPPTPGTVVNTAAVSGSRPDPNPADNTTTVSTMIDPAVLSTLRLSPPSFFAALRGASSTRRRGARVSYRLSARSRVRFTVERPALGRKVGRRCVGPTRKNRGRKRCTRWVRMRGSFDHIGRLGSNSLRFSGRLRRRALRPGRYRLVATPRAGSGAKGTPKRKAFRIKR